MNNFLYKLRMWIANFMQGRHGPDQFGIFTLIAGLVLSLLSSFIGQKYIALTANTKTKARQFVLRQKNKKDYKYFRCPQCKVLLRMKRGTGEKEITCAKCGHQFTQKA